MEKSKNFFETYFREIGFVVLLAYFVVMMLCGADENTVNGSVYRLASLCFMALFFCLYVIMLGYKAESCQHVKFIKNTVYFSAAAMFCVSFVYSCYLQKMFSVSELIKLVIPAVGSVIFCQWYLNLRMKKNEYLEYMRIWRHGDYLREMIRREKFLNGYEQLKIFNLQDAEKLICDYMSYARLDDDAEQRLIEQPYIFNIVKNMPLYSFTSKGDARLFYRPQAEKLVLLYVQNGNTFNRENELKMFELSNAVDVVREYIRNSSLSPDAEQLLLKMSGEQNSDLAEDYAQRYGFSKKTQEIIRERGCL